LEPDGGHRAVRSTVGPAEKRSGRGSVSRARDYFQGTNEVGGELLAGSLVEICIFRDWRSRRGVLPYGVEQCFRRESDLALVMFDRGREGVLGRLFCFTEVVEREVSASDLDEGTGCAMFELRFRRIAPDGGSRG